MSHAKNSNRSYSFINPFDKRDAKEVWKELLTNSEPVSHEEMIKQVQEETEKKQNNTDKKD